MSGITDSYELRERIRQASSTADLHRLVLDWQGKEGGLLGEIARYSPVWDEGLVLLVLQRPEGAVKLLGNPLRPPLADRTMARWMVNRLHSEAIADTLASARDSLFTLIQQGRLPWSWSETQEIVEIALPKKNRKKFPKRREMAIDLLIAHSEAPREVLSRIYEISGDYVDRHTLGNERLALLVTHPNSDEALWRPFVESLTGFTPAVLRLLSMSQAIRLDGEIRPRMVEAATTLPSADLLWDLVKDAKEDCGYCLLALAITRPQDAALLLNEASPEVDARLSQEDLQKLLQSSQQALRLASIQALGRIHGERANKEHASPPTPSQRSH